MRSFIFGIAALLIAPALHAAEDRAPQLTMHAVVTSLDGDLSGSYALLFIGGALVDSTGVEAGFTLDLPLGVEALLEVHKPGAITKQVALDTRNAPVGAELDCAVLLFPQLEGEHQRYALPVGRFYFEPSSGSWQVARDYRLETASAEVAVVPAAE